MQDYDAQLMQRAARGEAAAFRELFDRHYGRAVNIAYRMLGDKDSAEDVAMEAFARIYESRKKYEPRAKFSTFLYRVVANLSINAAKRHSTIKMEPLDEICAPAADSADPAICAQRSETAEVVRSAVLSLPDNQAHGAHIDPL